VVNTSRVVDEDMVQADAEPEIISVMPAGDWRAVVGGEELALAAFVALDDGRMHGVVVGDDGKIDLTDDVEDRKGFVRYEKTNREEEN